MGMLKSAIKINFIIGGQGFLLHNFVDSLIFTLLSIDQFPFFYSEDRTFGVDFSCSSTIKPVDGATICDPVRSDNRAMGRSKALAQDTAIEYIHILVLDLPRPFISGIIY